MNRAALSLVLGLLGSAASFSAVPIGRTGESASPRAATIRLQYSGDTTRGLEALTPEQQKAFFAAANSVEFPLPELRSADAAMWERVREAHPALASLSDEELNATCTSYIEAKPSITDVLFKTPVGPVFALNIIAAATGFSWCDVPFVNSDSLACAQQAARMAGQ